MLHLIHNLTHVWPKPIWYLLLVSIADAWLMNILYSEIVLNNWLVNPTGNLFSWVEVDLMQEHMNFWIKVRNYCVQKERRLTRAIE
jgi:hypothetical protein